jgi:hypothetical protein
LRSVRAALVDGAVERSVFELDVSDGDDMLDDDGVDEVVLDELSVVLDELDGFDDVDGLDVELLSVLFIVPVLALPFIVPFVFWSVPACAKA